MCTGWCNNWVTRQHAPCNNENMYDITFRKMAFFCNCCENLNVTWNMHDYEFYFICFNIDQCINTVQILWYFRNDSTSVVNCLPFSLHKKYFLYSPTSHKILLYHLIACTGDVTTYLSTTLKMATWLGETCRHSLCNKITFINRSTFVGHFNKFILN
jgi:hypothetical protein